MKYFYLLSLALVTPMQVFAQSGSGGNPSSGNPVIIENPLKDSAGTLTGLFEVILDVIMVFAVPIIVFFIIFAGFQYVVARGNPEAISKANRALLYAVIGGLLILGAQIILSVIGGTVDAVAG